MKRRSVLLTLAARHAAERWLNLFLGAYMLLRNGLFAWRIAADPEVRAAYSERLIGGAIHHDFMAMQEEWGRLSTKGVAQATVLVVVLGTAIALWLAYRHRDHYDA